MWRPLIAPAAMVLMAAGPIVLEQPVDCALGQNCSIQNYVDRDPGPGYSDLACGAQSYDGHKGTDFRLNTLEAMRRGVAVLAAVAGRVQGRRDGMADHSQGDPGAPDIGGRECGNGVVLVHEDGWTTQYCHLRKGSVTVHQGDMVEAGAVLGEIGLSGHTEFPHLHFTLRDPEGQVIDPFDGNPMDAACGAPPASPLWNDPAIAHAPGGHLAWGILDWLPQDAEVRDHAPTVDTLAPDADAMVVWGHFHGLQKGSRIVLTLLGPDGRQIVQDIYEMDRPRARQFRAAGRKRPGGGWHRGLYKAEITLQHPGNPPVTRTQSLEVR